MRDEFHGREWLVPFLRGLANELQDTLQDTEYWYKQAMQYRDQVKALEEALKEMRDEKEKPREDN